MGRYYQTNTGREGKFMFGVQPSDDPEYLGMVDQAPSTITYYADEDNVEEIKQKLDQQYDILELEKDQRIYLLPEPKANQSEWQVYDEWEDKYLRDKVWKTYHENDEELEQYKGQVNWASRKGNDYVDVEVDPKRTLALARVRLALAILTDIKETGSCELDAEL